MLRFQADPSTFAGWQMKDYYTLLGLHPGADEEALKAAFRQCVQRHHPDVGGDEAHFREILEAYETLSDQDRRTEYDIAYVEHFPGFTLFDADTGEELEIEYEAEPAPAYVPEPEMNNNTGLIVLLLIVLPVLGFGFSMVIGGDPVDSAIVAAICAVAAVCIGFLIREFMSQD
jgi:curved DNA-binding protein CbpA